MNCRDKEALDRRLGERRRMRLQLATEKLVHDRRAREREKKFRYRVDSARFNDALAAWHSGPKEFAAWQLRRALALPR